MSTKEFEVLAIDESGRSTIDSEHQLAYSVLSNSLISSDGTYDKAKHEIVVHATKIKVSKIATDVSDAHFGKGFLLKAKGPYSELEPLREKLVAHIKSQHFGPLYLHSAGRRSNIRVISLRVVGIRVSAALRR